MNPVITTVIPTYRRPALLRRAVLSVLRQTYPHVRACVYDNASGDETADVIADIARSDPRVVYHRHAENIGTFANFSFGLDAVDTPYFSFLSDDDVLLPDFYLNAVTALERQPDAAFWGGTAIVMRDDGSIKDATDWPAAYYTPPEGLRAMIANNHLIWTSVLFRTGKVRMIGGLDPDVGAPIDTDYMLRIAAELPFITSPEPSAIWMSHPESSTVLADPSFVWPKWPKAIRNITGNPRVPAPVRAEVGADLTEQLKRQLFQIGYNSIKQGKVGDARQVAAVLRDEYGQKRRARLLNTAAAAVSICPPARQLVPIAERLRRLGQRDALRRNAQLQARLGHYARYIALP